MTVSLAYFTIPASLAKPDHPAVRQFIQTRRQFQFKTCVFRTALELYRLAIERQLLIAVSITPAFAVKMTLASNPVLSSIAKVSRQRLSSAGMRGLPLPLTKSCAL